MGVEQAQHQQWMEAALAEARQAELLGEVPVGAVVVLEDRIVGRGHNRVISDHDPSAHAEIVALRDAAARCGNYRLPESFLYVTLEPCAMCAGSIVHARVAQLFFGASDPKTGVIHSCDQLLERPYHNHKTEWHGGLLEPQCRSMLQDFFRRRRASRKHQPPTTTD